MTTPSRHFAYAFAIILLGLAARAGIDKLLALSGGAAQVAQWAQLQSLVEMVVGVVAVGLGQGLTVLVAQQPAAAVQRTIFRAALALGAGLAGLVALALFGLLESGRLAAWWPQRQGLAGLTVATGWLAGAAALASAYWLGRQRQDQVFWLSAATLLPPVMAAAGGASIAGILWTQFGAGLVVSALTAGWVLRRAPGGGAEWPRRRWPIFFAIDAPARPLWRYLPVGLSIGLASPLSQVLARGEVSAALSWHDAGVMQAIWRSSEWVTACMAGVLSLVYLPRFSRALQTSGGRFATELKAAARPVLGATAALLLLLWLNQRALLALLYDAGVVAADGVVGLFLLGECLRVASWIILFGLLARRATLWVAIGEFFSLPLFAALVILLGDGMTLERAGWLYLATYAIYLGFNLLGLRASGKA